MKKKLRISVISCVLFSLLWMLMPQHLFAEDTTSPIDTFSISWSTKKLTGVVDYDATDPKKVTITPSKNAINAAGTSISAQVKLDLTNPFISKNALKIKLPKTIFKDRNMQDAGSYSIGLSKGEDALFNYTESTDGKSLIITNTQDITEAMTLLFDVTYYSYNKEENLLPSTITSGQQSKVQAELYLNDTLDRTSDELQVSYQTKADLISIEKGKHQKWETWQSEWGSKPEDAKDYFYICWSIRGELADNSVRPVKITLTDTVSNEGSVVGWYDYKFDDFLGDHLGHSNFVQGGTTKEIEQDTIDKTKFITHVVVKYPRKDFETSPKIENTITAELSDLYMNDRPSIQAEKNSTAAYVYSKFNFVYPPGKYNLVKGFTNYQNWGNSISRGYFNIMEKSKIGDELPEIYGHWMNKAETYGGVFTRDENAAENDVDSYGKNPYTVELVDDFITLENERLDEKDYAFTTVNVSFDEANLVVNEEASGGIGHTEKADTNYGEWSDTELFGKTSLDGEWEKIGKFTCNLSKQFDFHPISGNIQNNVTRTNPVVLPEGIVAIKAEHKSKHYKNTLFLEIRMKLRKTEHVAKLMEGKNALTVNNVDTLRVLDYKGNWVNPQKKDTIQGNDIMKDLIIARDEKAYGTAELDHYGLHKNAELSLASISTDSVIKKELKSTQNDTTNNRFSLNYQAYALETAYSDYFDPFDKQTNPVSIDEQRTGVVYDLLPKGMYVDANQIKVANLKRSGAFQYTGYDSCDYTVEYKENWKNSGRTMMILHISVKKGEKNHLKYTNITPDGWEWESGFFIEYTGYYPWESYFDYGGNLLNSLAYKTGNESITNGYPDVAEDSFLDKEWFTDVDGDGIYGETAPKDSLYAFVSTTISGDTSSKLGYFKSVKNQQDLKYTSSTEVLSGETYSYRLQYSSDKMAKAQNLVFFDVLEDDAGDDAHWKGTLQYVDVSSAIRKGIDAKVLYSIKEDIHLGNDAAGLKNDANIDDPTIWTTEKPSDLSKVTAIAVDLRKKDDGSDFVLEPQQQVSALIYMKAPIDNVKQYMENQVKAYNASWVNANTQVTDIQWSDTLLKTNRTTVSVREPEIDIHKISNPASGTKDMPAKVVNHDSLTYDISIKNKESSILLNAIKVQDVIPSGLNILFDDIAWYMGNDPTKQQLVKDTDFVDVERDAQAKQKLIFKIQALSAGEELHFIIPTKVTDNGDDTLFENTAKIIEVHQHSFEKESETTYHELDITTADFLFYKIDEEGNKLANAKFAAYELNCKSDAHDHTKDIVKLDQDGNVVSNDPCWKKRSIAISQESDGRVKLTGLNIEKQYRLVEYMAPIGYVLPAGQWMLAYDTQQKAFQITGSLDNPPAFERKEDDSFELMNYRLKEIPITGSIGYDEHLYLLGLGCIFYGSLLFWRKKKKLKERGGE